MNPQDNFNLAQAVDLIAANLHQPDRFSQIFCEAAKKQKDIDNILKENIRFLLQHDNETRTSIKAMIREVEKEDFRFLLKKGLFAVYGVSMLLIGAIITAIVSKLIH